MTKKSVSTKRRKEKKKKELNPVIEEFKQTPEEMESLLKKYEKMSTVIETVNEGQGANTDTFFIETMRSMDGKENISRNTDYGDTEDEAIFCASVLETVGDCANVPIINEFIDRLEQRKVSKGRKGRIEKVIGLQRRQEQFESESRNAMANMGKL